MAVESIEEVGKLWKTKQITAEQVIGKILLLLLQYQTRLVKLEKMMQHARKKHC